MVKQRISQVECYLLLSVFLVSLEILGVKKPTVSVGGIKEKNVLLSNIKVEIVKDFHYPWRVSFLKIGGSVKVFKLSLVKLHSFDMILEVLKKETGRRFVDGFWVA